MSGSKRGAITMKPPKTKVEKILELMEDNNLVNSKNYNLLVTELTQCKNVEAKIAERIFTLCVRDLREDIFKNVANVASVISVLLAKIKDGHCECSESCLKLSAGSILEVLPMLRRNNIKTESLRGLCYNTLSLYPDSIMACVALEEFRFIDDLIMSFANNPIHYDITYIFSLLQRILKTIPPDKKSDFVKDGISVWFSLLPPTLYWYAENPKEQNTLPIEVFETLTDEIVNFEYSENLKWCYILQHISQSNKYPALLKSLLENGNNSWHRLWIIFIKLLNKQIIKVVGPGGSPINSMLPVVEIGFKMDSINRCRAFECWNVLIENFASAKNDLVLHKKVKLMMIPLKSGNSRTEPTALAKFNTWWLLIRKFRSELDKYADSILIPFLQFCFGNHSDKTAVTPPGLLTNQLKQLCIQSLVEIFGHVDCDGCTDVPKLDKNILSTQNLVRNWNDWVYSFMTAVKFMSSTFEDKHKKWMLCLQQSLLETLGQLPDNYVRRDLIGNVLEMWILLIKSEIPQAHLPCIVLDVLLPSLTPKGTSKVNELLFIKGKDKALEVHKIVIEVMKLVHKLFDSCDLRSLVKKLKPMLNTVLEDQSKSFDQLINVLETDCEEPLILWTLIAETMLEYNIDEISQQNCQKCLKWPLINPQKTSIFDIKYASLIWLKLYNIVLKMRAEELDMHLLKLLQSNNDSGEINFRLAAALSLSSSKSPIVRETAPEVLQNIIHTVNSYEQLEYILPILMESFSSLIQDISLERAKSTLMIISNYLKLICREYKNHAENVKVNKYLPSIFKNVLVIFNLSEYHTLIPLIANEITDCFKIFKSVPEINETLNKINALFLSNINDESILHTIKGNFKDLKDKSSTNTPKSTRAADKTTDVTFMTPLANKPVKAKKIKEPNIVDTVVVDGEEYVVVKSQWKFNPKKMTENQKEKLVKKREDIPALYQDLSQSQDEFKMSKWKADSQDSSSTSSISTSKIVDGDETSNLKNILTKTPNIDVVPNIIENLLSNNDSPTNNSTKSCTDKKDITTPKTSKTPKMALQDRVFRNVRNLLQNSSTHKESSLNVDKDKNCSEVQNMLVINENNALRTPNNRLKTIMDAVNAASASKVFPEKLSTANSDNHNETPISKMSNDDILKSAPAKLCAERPSRYKRKPKKFDDLELIELKRRKNNVCLNDCQSFTQPETQPVQDSPESNIINNEKYVLDDNNDNLKDTIENLNEVKVIDVNVDVDIEKIMTETLINQNKDVCQDNINNDTKEKESNNDPVVKNTNNEMVTSTSTDSVIAISNHSDKINTTHDDSKSLLTSATTHSSTVNTSTVSDTEEKLCINNGTNGKKCETMNSKQSTTPETTFSLTPTMKTNELNGQKSSTKKSTHTSTLNTSTVSDTEEKLCINNSTNGKKCETMNSKQSTTPETTSLLTPTMKTKELNGQKSSTKKSTSKKSRIERELAIDTVEGHPLLSNEFSKRTRKRNLNFSGKTKSAKSEKKPDTPKSEKKSKKAKKMEGPQNTDSVVIIESQDKNTQEPCSEDVIESSQDSSITMISVTSTKSAKKVPAVISKKQSLSQEISPSTCTQSLLDNFDDTALGSKQRVSDAKDDTLLPQNKTAPGEINPCELTANLDTEPINHTAEDVVIINDEPLLTITINSQNTEDFANADTQPIDPNIFGESPREETGSNSVTSITTTTQDVCVTGPDLICKDVTEKDSESSPSPDKDEIQRKQDFLNNTFEISPIKVQSPIRDEKSPSPETSKDFVVIKLTSPVNSNGEPLEKSSSPELFSENKGSLDYRDQSPPRDEPTLINNNSSPSASLSLKKTRPQLQTHNRARQMLGLCVANKMESISSADKTDDSDEPKHITNLSTPVRKNLKIFYADGDNENVGENEDNENFLKLKRSLPAVDSSPAGPILKRKLVDITDDAMISPASKRKRVSFHDPPVSTTVSVQKYIEPGVIRSPQPSLAKRKERELQKEKGKLSNTKSPKRLDTVFKLDTALTKAVESFSENDTTVNSSNDTQMSSLDKTPVVKLVRISDLDDKNPICLDLIGCKDPISKIAIQLSSPAMHSLLIKELEGKIETIGDLAKLSEVEVNRLCIKAPKVSIAKKVLNEYLLKLSTAQTEGTEETQNDQPFEVSQAKSMNVESQTENVVQNSSFMQTDVVSMDNVDTQTDVTSLSTVGVQTVETGSKSTADIVKTCLLEKPDFISTLNNMLDESSKEKIAEKITFDGFMRLISKQINTENSKSVIDHVLNTDCVIGTKGDNAKLQFLQYYLSEMFDSKDLILFCSQLLQKVYDKPT